MSLFRRRRPQPTEEWFASTLARVQPDAPASVLRPDDADDPALLELGPVEERPWFTIVTTSPGLSSSHGIATQLMIALPPSTIEVDRLVWADLLLRPLFSYGRSVSLSKGNSIGNGEPPDPYLPGWPFVGALLWDPTLTTDSVSGVLDGTPFSVDLLAVFPLHPDELRVVRDDGFDAILDRLDDAEVSEIIEPRNSVV